MSGIHVTGLLDRYFFPDLASRKIYPLFLPRPRRTPLQRLARKAMLKREWVFADWIHALKRGEKVVFHETAFIKEEILCKLLRRYAGNMIVFLWNPVGPHTEYVVRHRHEVKIYSHDRSDCEKYGLAFKNTFYHKTDQVVPASRRHDLVFLGALKNRHELLDHYHRELSGELDVLFHVYRPDQTPPNPGGVPLESRFMPYPEYLGHIVASRGILDVMQQGQNSLTMRAMESIFFRKKLVTTYRGIAQEDFYHPFNIMVIDGPDDLKASRVRDFLDSDYVDIDPAIVSRYDYDQWICSFN